MVQQSPPVKRKRGRPRKEAIEQRAEGDSPLWAIVDQLTLIHDDLKRMLKLMEAVEGSVPNG